jgi:Tol biopolymer transport system component
VMDADGTNQVRLTDNAASDRNPAFSPNPDGSRIAFTSTRVPSGSDIFVMGAVDSDNDGNGDNLVRFTGAQSDSSPAWSPDGTKIAFQSGRDDPQGDIYVMDAAPESGTNKALRLTDTTEGDFEPNWSPDGSKIVFTSGRDGNFEIYVMNADGSAPKRLTKKGPRDSSPAWSPDGSKIAFRSERGGDPEVYVMKAKPESKKNRPRNLTKNALFDSDPDWQPVAP